MTKQEIPFLTVRGEGLAEAWKNSLFEVWKHGLQIKTEYDRPEDPPSFDSTMTIVVDDPLSEPMIHRDMPGGLEDLQEYVMEVCDGIKDHLVRDPNDPNDKRWEYTYHERLFKFSFPGGPLIDQVETLVKKLSKTPHTRRAQVVTWKVWEDNSCYDPACLQSIWCRMTSDEADGWILNTNVRFRSNDAYKAAMMNMFALTMLQKRIAEQISSRTGAPVRVGRYIHSADSYHIYGSYLKEFRERFVHNCVNRSFEDQTFRYCDVKDIMDEAIPGILKKAKEMR